MASIYQVNDTDYDGEIVVEFYGFHGRDELFWAVPAWDEHGYPEMSGPFDSTSEARSALDEFLGVDATYFESSWETCA